MAINIIFLDKDKNVLFEWRGAACYAGIKRHIKKYKPAFIKTHLPECGDWSSNQIEEYCQIVKELFPKVDKKLNGGFNSLIKELQENKSYTLPVTLNAFDNFAICSILRYLQEDTDIINVFFKITNQHPKLPKWKAFVLAHSRGFGNLGRGHTIIFPRGDAFIPVNLKPQHIMSIGRKAVKYKTAYSHRRFGSGYLCETFEKLYAQEERQELKWYDPDYDKPEKNIPAYIDKIVKMGEQVV